VNYKIWIGVGLSLVLLGVAFRGVHVEDLARSLREVRLFWLLPVLLSVFVRFWLTALRWHVILRPTKAIGIHRLFGVTMIGFMANNILPARMGEFVRAYALGKVETLSIPLAFATIVVERVFDGFTLLLFLVGGLLFLHPQPWLLWSAVASCGLYLAVLATLLVLRDRRRIAWLTRLVAWLPVSLQGRVAAGLASFALGLHVLGDSRAVAAVSVLSLAIWLVNVAGLQAMFVAFSLPLPVHAAFLLLAVIAVALVLPSAPGYVGTFQVGTVAGLALFSVPEAIALSLSLVFHAVNYVPITVVGLAYLSAMKLTLGELRAVGGKAS
jgi:uncharacterized protein (TIRG00374 family)